MMVGRTIYESAPEVSEDSDAQVVLEVKGLNRGAEIKDVSFKLKRGEILGFAGLMGAGRTEVARAIFGADSVDAGEIYIEGKRVQMRTPRDAVRQGIGYLSEDRKRYGLALGMNVEANVVLAAFKKFVDMAGIVNRRKTLETTRHYIDALAIKTPGPQQRVRNLSGGNQQKVVIGKWLTADTQILIFDEPTRGIDVGAKSEIYGIIRRLSEEGKSIMIFSSELPEIMNICDSIYLLFDGSLKAALRNGDDVDSEKIIHIVTGGE
jgi:ribose transport system ATP-binding protein